MTGFASMIRSPSTLRMTRSTPCVDGCWGPKFTSISWTSNMSSGSWPLALGSWLSALGRHAARASQSPEPRAQSQELRAHQLFQHVLRFLFARHAERQVFGFSRGDRVRVAFAIPAAGRAVGL